MGIHLMVGPHMFLEGLLIQWIICGIQKLYNYDYETTDLCPNKVHLNYYFLKGGSKLESSFTDTLNK